MLVNLTITEILILLLHFKKYYQINTYKTVKICCFAVI